jgi:hypothetical protein
MFVAQQRSAYGSILPGMIAGGAAPVISAIVMALELQIYGNRPDHLLPVALDRRVPSVTKGERKAILFKKNLLSPFWC